MEISDLIGMPYTKEHDCNWLASVATKRAGVNYHNVETPESKDDWPKQFRKVLLEHYKKTKTPKEGDLVVFAIPDGKETGWHCGVVTRPGWMVTTRGTVGVHLARLNNPLWQVTVRGFYEFVA